MLGADDKKDKNLHFAEGHGAGKCRGSQWLQNLVRNPVRAAGPGRGQAAAWGTPGKLLGVAPGRLAETQKEGSGLRRNRKQGSLSWKSFS